MTKVKKFLAMLLCMAMFISLLPTWALAEEIAEPVENANAELLQEEQITEEVYEEPTENSEQQTVEDTESAAVIEDVSLPDPVEDEKAVDQGEEADAEEAETKPESADGVEPAEGSENSTTDIVGEPVADEKIAEETPVTVVFNVTPEDAVVTVYTKNNPDDPEEKTEIKQEEDGGYLLYAGIYYYDVKAENYQSLEEERLEINGQEKTREITLSLEKVESTEETDTVPVKIMFAITPENAELIVYTKDEYDEKTEIDPEEDGSYLLLPGEYFYTLTAEGYLDVEDEKLEVEASEEPIEVELTLVQVQPEEGIVGTEETAELMASTILSGSCGANARFRLDSDGKLTITGSGAMYDYTRETTPWYAEYKDPVLDTYHPYYYDIKNVAIGEGITRIGKESFNGCIFLSSISLPSTLKSIGSEAFLSCVELSGITLPEGLTSLERGAFACCGKLTSIQIPSNIKRIENYSFWCCSNLRAVSLSVGITSIGDLAFAGCSSLTSVKIPAGVTNIGELAFSDCSSLTSVKIPTGVKTIGEGAFYNCSSLANVEIPSGVKSIGQQAFSGCSGLTNVKISASVTSIGRRAFQNCSSLRSVELPAGVTSIEDATFYGCSGLMRVEIPDGVKSIKGGAFYGCSSLASVKLPASVTSIGAAAFRECSSLTDVKIPASVTSIGEQAFQACSALTSITIPAGVTSIENDTFYECSNLASVKIPTNTKNIGAGVFYKCSSLTSVELPVSLASIGEYAFAYCSGLTSITIPAGVASIGECAFYGCSGLTSITIPAGVTSIGEGTFAYCSNLKSAEIPASVTSIGIGGFSHCSALTSVKIPNTVTNLGSKAFSICSNLENIYFLGRKPDNISSDSFNDVTATVYYPGDGSWREEDLLDYGGNLTWVFRFADVCDPSAYFYQPVYWAVDNGITAGTSATTFSPFNSCTRAQVMAFLWKAMGSPEVSAANPFTDVKESDYFYKAVLWAVSQGITSGTSATTFSPYNTCTRAQVMSFLWKAKGSPVVGGSNPFTDVKESDYFYNAVLWAVANGITSGTSATTFAPYKTCTRAQVMTFLYKAMG